jgi:hypothetical protein
MKKIAAPLVCRNRIKVSINRPNPNRLFVLLERFWQGNWAKELRVHFFLNLKAITIVLPG